MSEQSVQVDVVQSIQQDVTAVAPQVAAPQVVPVAPAPSPAHSVPASSSHVNQVVNVTVVQQVVPNTVKPTDDLRVTNEHVATVVSNINSLLSGKPLNKTNMLRIALNVMSITSAMNDLPNRLKKVVLLRALESCVNTQCDKDSSITPEERELLIILIQEVVSEVIDLAHEVSEGVIKVAKGGCCVMM